MKSTGIVRKVDELGRIVLPIEMRRTLDIAEKDTLEIYVEGALFFVNFRPPVCSATAQRTSLILRAEMSAPNALES